MVARQHINSNTLTKRYHHTSYTQFRAYTEGESVMFEWNINQIASGLMLEHMLFYGPRSLSCSLTDTHPAAAAAAAADIYLLLKSMRSEASEACIAP